VWTVGLRHVGPITKVHSVGKSDMNSELIDRFGRQVTYLRLSVTDRCDFRCVYCMAEEMVFLPRAKVLTLEELFLIGQAFVELGVKKIRITGGEPLIRRNVMKLFNELGELQALDELTLTTNGSQLTKLAPNLKTAGVHRINVSLDSLNPEKFHSITRTGNLNKVLAGIDTAKQQGFSRIKINAVILKQRNEKEVLDLLDYALDNGFDISYIEEMPLGVIDDHDRALEFCSSQELRDIISSRYSLFPTDENTGGPSKYWRIDGYRSRGKFLQNM